MRAMVLKEISAVEKEPLKIMELPKPVPGPKEVLIKVSACGVCHTELDEIETKLSYLDEVGKDEVDDDEMKAYLILKELDKTRKTKVKKAEAIAKILKQ